MSDVFNLTQQHRSNYVEPDEAERRLRQKLPPRPPAVLRRAIEAGTLAFVQVGVKRVFPRPAFDAWIATL